MRHARGADARAGGVSAGAPPRARRVLLCAHRCDRRPCRAARAAGGGLARRARRPQHPGDVAVGQRGGWHCGRRSRRGPSRPGTSPSSARNLDPAEQDYLVETGIDDDVPRATADANAVYVALDIDVLDPGCSPRSSRSQAGCRSTKSKRYCAESSAPVPLAGMGVTELPTGSGHHRHRASRRCCRPVTALAKGRSKMAQMSEPDRIDISIEHKRAEPEPSAKRHPNTCGVWLALPGRGAHAQPPRLRPVRHHFPVRAPERIAQLADPGTFTEANEDLRSADPLRFFDLKPYTERLAEAELSTGLGDALITGTARIESVPCRLAVMDFSFMGGSMGSVVGEKFARACEASAADGTALVSVSASGGARMQEDPLADAAPEDGLRGGGAARRRRRAYLGARTPDGRPARELRLAGRRTARRAGCADVVRGPARRRADDAGEAS